MVHGWGHNIQIANNRVYNNQGTLSGGITVGQGEHPDVYLAGGMRHHDSWLVRKQQRHRTCSLPYCFDMNVNVHHNAVIQNSSLGDELFSSTPAGAGGVTICNGSDYYKFNNNWVCGNMSTGDGGGVVHLGFTKNGDIEHNAILFNQSTNPTITTNGGGLLVMGAPDLDPPCARPTTRIASLRPATITPSDGTGPGLVINANLIMGNAADSGSGGGLRLQHINGTDVLNFPNGSQLATATSVRNQRHLRLPLEHGQSHQQHHRQQRGWLGWRRRIAAGCAGGEHHQQHDRLQRLHGLLGRALRFAVRTVGQHPGTQLHGAQQRCTILPAGRRSGERHQQRRC